jgi:hypothetical protein
MVYFIGSEKVKKRYIRANKEYYNRNAYIKTFRLREKFYRICRFITKFYLISKGIKFSFHSSVI